MCVSAVQEAIVGMAFRFFGESCSRPESALVFASMVSAAIAQLGERQTEDLEVPGSIPGLGTFVIQGGRRPHGQLLVTQSAHRWTCSTKNNTTHVNRERLWLFGLVV